jgi:cytochrome P450
VLLIAEMFRRFDFHVVDPARVRPAARLTTRPTEQIMMRVTRADA